MTVHAPSYFFGPRADTLLFAQAYTDLHRKFALLLLLMPIGRNIVTPDWAGEPQKLRGTI
jgi:hypothetical protein